MCVVDCIVCSNVVDWLGLARHMRGCHVNVCMCVYMPICANYIDHNKGPCRLIYVWHQGRYCVRLYVYLPFVFSMF